MQRTMKENRAVVCVWWGRNIQNRFLLWSTGAKARAIKQKMQWSCDVLNRKRNLEWMWHLVITSLKSYFRTQGKCKQKKKATQKKTTQKAMEESLQLGAACRWADDAAELVCLILRNTWAEILQTQDLHIVLNSLCEFSLSSSGNAVRQSQYEAFLFTEIPDKAMQTHKWD